MITTSNILPPIPMTSTVLSALIGNYKAPLSKIAELEKHGDVVRLKRGVYIPNSQIDDNARFMIANNIVTPSYISHATALRYYGLIPEYTATITSVTMKRKTVVNNKMGRFSYEHIAPEFYSIGVDLVVDSERSFQIATPEKALADYIVLTSGLRLRYLKETFEFLRDDLRIDMDLFSSMRPEMFDEFAEICPKRQAMLNIAKLLRR